MSEETRPAAGGRYLRDPATGELTRVEEIQEPIAPPQPSHGATEPEGT